MTYTRVFETLPSSNTSCNSFMVLCAPDTECLRNRRCRCCFCCLASPLPCLLADLSQVSWMFSTVCVTLSKRLSASTWLTSHLSNVSTLERRGESLWVAFLHL